MAHPSYKKNMFSCLGDIFKPFKTIHHTCGLWFKLPYLSSFFYPHAHAVLSRFRKHKLLFLIFFLLSPTSFSPSDNYYFFHFSPFYFIFFYLSSFILSLLILNFLFWPFLTTFLYILYTDNRYMLQISRFFCKFFLYTIPYLLVGLGTFSCANKVRRNRKRLLKIRFVCCVFYLIEK